MKIIFSLGVFTFLILGCQQSQKVITSFEECVEETGVVMESYPRQCRFGDQNFVEEITAEIPVEETLQTDTFSGTLETVNVGCFADGECFIEVDGKHITAIMGWSQETVGSIKGVEGFGDLELHIGKQVEVYARDLGTGKYTLYGDENFYIQLQ